MKILNFKVEDDIDDCAFPNGVVVVDQTECWDRNTIEFGYFTSRFFDKNGKKKEKTVRVLYVTPPSESKSINTYIIRVRGAINNKMHGAVKGKANYHRIYEELEEKFKQAQNEESNNIDYHTIKSLNSLVVN